MGSWDFMYPRGYRPRRSGGRHHHKKNLCLECKADIGKPTIGGPGGRKVQLRYCQKHYCARILANGTICSDKNNGRSAYCDHRESSSVTSRRGTVGFHFFVAWAGLQRGRPIREFCVVYTDQVIFEQMVVARPLVTRAGAGGWCKKIIL